jgi:predicted transcriptional regulator
MFGWFSRKKEVEEVRQETKQGFEAVKKDMVSISEWIKHLDSEKSKQDSEISDVKEILSSLQQEVEGIKNIVSLMNEMKIPKQRQTTRRLSNKQTAVYAVDTPVQTGVQTPNLDNFSVTERAILWILLNTDLKLSYDDLAAMLGKEKSTIRGQINAIKQKSELQIIQEQVEKNGKKRVHIPEELKEKMLKKAKVSIKTHKKRKK